MWVADDDDDKLYAYAVADGTRQQGKEIDFPGFGPIWSDGTTLWMAAVYSWQRFGHRSGTAILAYSLSDGSRQPDKDYKYYWWPSGSSFSSTFPSISDNTTPAGIWSNGATMWVMLDGYYRNIVGYKAIPPTKRLEASSITATAATLTLHWHTDAWWYQRTAGSPADTTCHSVGRHHHRQPCRADRRPVLHLQGLRHRGRLQQTPTK